MAASRGTAPLLNTNELNSFSSFLDGLGDDSLSRAMNDLVQATSTGQPLPDEWAGLTLDEIRSILRDSAATRRREMEASQSLAQPSIPATAAASSLPNANNLPSSNRSSFAFPSPVARTGHGISSSTSAPGSFQHTSQPGAGAGTFNLLASPPRAFPSYSHPSSQTRSTSNPPPLDLTKSPLGLSNSTGLPPVSPASYLYPGQQQHHRHTQHHQHPLHPVPQLHHPRLLAPGPSAVIAPSTAGTLDDDLALFPHQPDGPGDGYLSLDPHVERAASALMNGLPSAMDPGAGVVVGMEVETPRGSRRPARESRKRASDTALAPPTAKRSKADPVLVGKKSNGAGPGTPNKAGPKSRVSRKNTDPAPGMDNPAITGKRAGLLSATQKKANHIQSEQKRRANIRRGYDALCASVPALRDEAAAAAAAAAATGDHAEREREKEKARSEGLVLGKTIEHIQYLLAHQAELIARLAAARRGHPYAAGDRSDSLWLRSWDGGRGVMVTPEGEIIGDDDDIGDGDGMMGGGGGGGGRYGDEGDEDDDLDDG